MNWDHEVDIVVVGSGCAGTAAAIEASRAGASVLVLEAASGPGGASSMSGGEVYLGGGTSLQHACGFEDEPDDMFAFLGAMLGPDADEAKLELYCEGSPSHFEWIKGLGVAFNETVFEGRAWLPPGDEGLMWLGERSHPFAELARPAPRCHRPAARGHGGPTLMKAMYRAAVGAGASFRFDNRVEGLVLDGDAVAGVRARHFRERVAIRARRGVVLAGGGFVFDDRMLRRHAPQLVGHTKIGTDADDGGAIRLAQGVGAATRLLQASFVGLRVSPALLAGSVLVNRWGGRFINEDTYPGRVSAAALAQGGDCFMVIDEATFESVPDELRLGQRPEWVASTVEELEAEMALPGGSLVATVRLYNEGAVAGRDLVFGKDPSVLRPLGSPFAAMSVRHRSGDPRNQLDDTGTGYGVFTLGGLLTDVDGAVQHVEDRPVPGLWAVGRTSSGIHGQGYISGSSLGDGTFFGRRAGRAVARAT